MSLNFKSTLF